jgi:DNA-binding HxlR family transcriptional regulator
MVKRTSLRGDYCPSARSIAVIGDWWSLLIVRDAFDGLTRFGEFQKSLGIAKNILSDRLRTLSERGILTVVAPADGGTHQEYHLTPKGRDLFPVMVALRQWGERYLFEPGEEHSRLVERDTGQAIQLEIRTADGRPVGPDHAVVLKVPQQGSLHPRPAERLRKSRSKPS